MYVKAAHVRTISKTGIFTYSMAWATDSHERISRVRVFDTSVTFSFLCGDRRILSCQARDSRNHPTTFIESLSTMSSLTSLSSQPSLEYSSLLTMTSSMAFIGGARPTVPLRKPPPLSSFPHVKSFDGSILDNSDIDSTFMDTRSSKEQFDLVKEKSLRSTLVRSCRVILIWWPVYSDETLPPMTLDLTYYYYCATLSLED